MLKKYALGLLLMLPKVVLALSCAPTSMADVAMNFQGEEALVAFRIVGITEPTIQFSYDYIFDVEVTDEFIKNQFENPPIQIRFNPFGDINGYGFTKDSEWLTVIGKEEESFFLSPCSPRLNIKDGIIIGRTGLEILDDSESETTLEKFRVAITAFKQAIDLANKVCSRNSNCENIKASYSPETGELNLPVIKLINSAFNGQTGKLEPPIDYSTPFVPRIETSEYVDVILQKTTDNPATFILKEIKPTWGSSGLRR